MAYTVSLTEVAFRMRFTRSHLLASTVLVGAITVSGAASAQVAQPSSDAQATEIGEIVVTGSRIRRSAANAPTPSSK